MRLIQGHAISPSASLPLRAAVVISMLGLLASPSAPVFDPTDIEL
jgi:hypothetical protein